MSADIDSIIHPIVRYPDERLRKYIEPVSVDWPYFGSEELCEWVAELKANCLSHEGIGLAANQIGFNVRAFAMVTQKEPLDIDVWFNPVWKPLSDERYTLEEGCLSLPGVSSKTDFRYKYVELTGLDEDGEQREPSHFSETYAVVVQHECDHLDGVLFFDYLSRLKKDRLLKKYEKTNKK